jgi:hypothetical protein
LGCSSRVLCPLGLIDVEEMPRDLGERDTGTRSLSNFVM